MQTTITSAWRCRVILFALLFSAATPSQAAGLGGSLQGQVTQDDPPMTFPMEMNLYGKVGNINYPTLSCGGNLQLIGGDGTAFWYREHITYGTKKCINGGTIELRRHALGDSRAWDWRWSGAGVSARGVVFGAVTEAP